VSSGGEKTNLFVFLTPHVIKSPVEAKDILKEKEQYMNEIKEGNIKMYNQSTDEAEPGPKE
jgi:general secretion pathway protein D